jgi:hypothetical protein
MSDIIKKNSKCRICGSKKLKKFLSLGKTPLANSFLKKQAFNKEKYFPLEVYFCENCYLSQLVDIVDKEKLFSQYVYFYSKMPTASQHFTTYTKDVIKRFVTNPKKELVLEFGSNDGILLKAFKENGCVNVLGVDPAKNIAKVANENGIPTIADFFSEKLAKKVSKSHGKAKVIIANNTVAHINDLQDMMKGIVAVLDNNGVFIFEAPYLIDMFENLAFDSIYHEHLSYLSISPLVYLFKLYGMEIFDVEITQRQGQSIRVFVSRSGQYQVTKNVGKLLSKEKKMGFDKIKSYRLLAQNVEKSKKKLQKLLTDLKKKKHTISAYGAPARGNTILNYCNIDNSLLDFATEELPSKIGFYTPGTHIPVISIEEARKKHPDFYLMLAWDYKDAILKKEKAFLKKGGKFIIPVENVKVI